MASSVLLYDLLASEMERSFELAIDMEIAALRILQKHHPRTVVERWHEVVLHCLGVLPRLACVR